MESPGEYIKRERKLREIRLQDVSEAIKVQAKLLKALEADDYDELPHSTFVKGFFRAYAKYLGLDDNDIVLRYEDYRKEFYDDIELESTLPVTYPPATIAGRPREKPGEHRKKQFIAAAVIVVVVLGAVAYFIFSGPVEVATLSGDAESQAMASAEEDVEGEGLAADADKNSPEPVEAAKVAAFGGKKSAGTKSSAVRKYARRAVKPPVTKKAIKEKPLAKPSAVSAIPESGHALVAFASAETWMRVEIDGVKAKVVLLQPGESVTWRGDKGFSLLLGNAGGVTLTFDGVDMGSPGGVGKTVRVNFPEGVELPRVVVKKVVPEKAPKVSKEITKPLEDAVKAAPVEAGVVKEDSIPSGTAEALPVGNESAPALPDVVKEAAEDATSPSETPVVNEAATDEEPLITDEAGATLPVNGDEPEEVPEGTTELNKELPADAPAAGVVEGEAVDAPSVKEALPSEGADASKEVPEALSEEIDLMEDDF